MEIGSFFGSFDVSVIVDKIYFFVGIFLLFAVLGGIVMIFLHLKSKKGREKNLKKIGWWEEVAGTERMEPGTMDDVEEIVLPGTMLRVFYCKDRDLWLPRFSKGVTKNLFYVLLTPTQQMVNFTLKSLSADLKEAKLDYDHTDMQWAAENMREWIKRNYRDKAVKWWQAYQGVITTAIYILVMTFSMVLIIYFLRGLVKDIGQTGEVVRRTLELAQQSSVSSGVLPA